ncbi:MAG: amidohydrolase [Prevotella sp.]|nr:amidohydrolase [Prevotella sp.]MBO5156741.1 amidohydrolase [Prevotella sp.]
MKVTILQRDILWAKPAENQQRAKEAMLAETGSDIYVLPEMWSTGFATHPEGIAETSCSSLHWMQKMAARLDAAVCGSIATETEGSYRNRFYFVYPDGQYKYYDKHHLFTFGGEHKQFTAGNDRVTVDFRGIRILLQVCYDLRFPTFARNSNSDRYDIAIYVASWPTVRVKAWSALLTARAIENQAFVVGVNRVGKDPGNDYCGASVILDAYGNTLAACTLNEECAATAELDMDALAAFRTKFPVLNDAD